MQFKYNYLNNFLWRLDSTNSEYSYEIDETNQFVANFGGSGFVLGENSWIIFSIYATKIRVFAKIYQKGEIIYYRKEIPIIPLNQLPLVVPNFAREIKFEFTPDDIVIKNEKGWWIPKKA
ncbi:MAG: hypothetical protein MRERV_4c104 [Mycoplasmataceae bacterium RV_VA103A]|nr:MAG: hypothetical protein MRERV_11c059 [Mycoplasmataceae bacterium RV_VA103A]KLL05193.1 MAG: hypothetical protein MRERV_4c104 [Mycoplasmataceae bacterium RV_VA103A]